MRISWLHGIPVEVRLQVYDRLFAPLRVYIHAKHARSTSSTTSHVRGCSRGRESSSKVARNLFLVCKAVKAEAEPIYYREALFFIDQCFAHDPSWWEEGRDVVEATLSMAKQQRIGFESAVWFRILNDQYPDAMAQHAFQSVSIYQPVILNYGQTIKNSLLRCLYHYKDRAAHIEFTCGWVTFIPDEDNGVGKRREELYQVKLGAEAKPAETITKLQPRGENIRTWLEQFGTLVPESASELGDV